MLKNNKTYRIRIDAKDAPETAMPYYRVKIQYLSFLCFGKIIRLEIEGQDRNNRYIGRGFLPDGRDISAEMIRIGMY